MKTRTGFVSNSSSSSFIAVATLDAFEAALLLINENERKIVRAIAEDDTCLGQKVKVVKEFNDAGGFSSIWGCDGDGKDEIMEKAGISTSCPQCDDEDDEAECTCDEDRDFVYEAIPDYFSAIEMLSKKKEWKNQVYSVDVGDGG